MKFVKENKKGGMRLALHQVGLPKTKEEWEKEADILVDKIWDALNYFCWNISGDTALECFSAHSDLDLYDLAEEFQGYSWSYLRKSELNEIRKMPEDVFDKATRKIQEAIEKTIEELREEYPEAEEEEEEWEE